MTLFDLVDFCARQGLDGLDATAYYFPGYPQVPPDAYLFDLKRHAFVNGVTIHGSGVRNDFAIPGKDALEQNKTLVKDWVVAASKLGASIVRVFSGREIPPGYTFNQVLQWMVPAFAECAAFAQRHGVVLGLQNHHDFVKTADETIRVVDAVGSPWMRVILDVGSLRQRDVYQEIAALLPYAVSWQVKEMVWMQGKEQPIDLMRLKQIVDAGGFRGFLPIETLGPGDPNIKVPAFLRQVRQAFGG
ncbi:MAG: sugar phosphate isomerase/epimerase [Bryobacterales bacterium]|nr:sugar phosphate isomerase/epimerase [Bryobacterales bacterium]